MYPQLPKLNFRNTQFDVKKNNKMQDRGKEATVNRALDGSTYPS